MNSLAKSLRCLTQPLTLVSLILLLVNDHVLKIVTPSWLTGKLSDFAGLFFFPFLLAALIAFIWRERLSARQVGALAFGITAVWFVLMKTTAWGNAFTENFASFVLQTRAQIVQDPTDVIALGAMVPGWALWEKTKTTRPPKWAWLVLFIAAFASIATSPLPPPPSVNRLVAQERRFLATGYSIPIATSEDGGQTWRVGNEQFPQDAPYLDLDRGICEPNARAVCYRLGNDYPYKTIEETDDAGKNWRTIWEIPPGRKVLIERLGRGTCGLFGCTDRFEPGPYDLALGAPFGANGRATLVAALGTEGVLVKTPRGEWNQYPVGKIAPTPMQITDLSEWGVIQPELEMWLYMGLAVLVILAIWGWCAAIGVTALDAIRPLWLSIALIVVGVFLIYIFPIKAWGWGDGLWSLLAGWAYPFLAVWLVIALFASAYWVEKRATNTRQIKRVIYLALLGALVFSMTSWLPMLAWAFGWIEMYDVARNMSILIALAITISGGLVLWITARAPARSLYTA